MAERKRRPIAHVVAWADRKSGKTQEIRIDGGSPAIADAFADSLRQSGKATKDSVRVEPRYAPTAEEKLAQACLELSAQVERVKFGLYRVPSTSEPGVVHTVYSDPHGGLHCTCVAGSTGAGKRCKHLRAVEIRREIEAEQRREARAAESRCVECGEPTPPASLVTGACSSCGGRESDLPAWQIEPGDEDRHWALEGRQAALDEIGRREMEGLADYDPSPDAIGLEPARNGRTTQRRVALL